MFGVKIHKMICKTDERQDRLYKTEVLNVFIFILDLLLFYLYIALKVLFETEKYSIYKTSEI